MTWPTAPDDSTLPGDQLDNPLDSPAAARAQILATKDRLDAVSGALKAVINHGDPMLANLPRAGGALTGAVHTARKSIGATTIDLATGNTFTKTITANTTFAVSNVPASGTTAAILVELVNGGAFTVTWWAGMTWPGGSAPTLTTAGRDLLGFMTYDGGTTWTGVLIGRDIK